MADAMQVLLVRSGDEPLRQVYLDYCEAVRRLGAPGLAFAERVKAAKAVQRAQQAVESQVRATRQAGSASVVVLDAAPFAVVESLETRNRLMNGLQGRDEFTSLLAAAPALPPGIRGVYETLLQGVTADQYLLAWNTGEVAASALLSD